MEGCLMLRKGAWTQQEDVLLRNCVQTNGEGNWHLVPAKAGLNRCRKSCRLRWLNYLKPDLKRGKFEEDEVDLLIKLHNLLGNRWSMIAKRLPGRTGNDVKNYWNTYLANKFKPATKNKPATNLVRVQVIRPIPSRTLNNIVWQPSIMKSSTAAIPLMINPPPESSAPVENDQLISWWETLLEDNNDPIGTCHISQQNTNNPPIEGSRRSFEDSLWAMLSEEEDHINQTIWENLGIHDMEL